MIRKPAWYALAGILTAVSLYSPMTVSHEARAAEQVAAAPVPAPVSKGVQKLVGLIPELTSRYVVYDGEVDGPGVSGVSVTFASSAAEKEKATDRAIFSGTGDLLKLTLAPKAAEKPVAWTDQQWKDRAAAFVADLKPAGGVYQPRTITREQSQTTVRLVKTWNNVAFEDTYDVLVTFDGTGRLVAFDTFAGKPYEPVDSSSLPSLQKALTAQQAAAKYAESRPLELVYLLPGEYSQAERVQAQLTYVVKDGVVRGAHTGSALDAFSGKRLAELASSGKQPVQTIAVNGTGEKWVATTEVQAQDLVRKLAHVEPGKLPLSSFTAAYDNGEERRFFIWGHFSEGTAAEDKQYQMGQFPEGVAAKERLHILLETDGKTGQLLRLAMSTAADGSGKPDKQRDWKTAEAILKRLLPSGTTQLQMRDAGNENLTLITADPLVNGLPVYQEGQTSEQGMYTILLDAASGNVKDIQIRRPADWIAPARTSALSEQEAVAAILKTYPLELTYFSQTDPQTQAVTWKLAYDLSFRQSKAHCFCGGEPKVDLTVRVDAVTGKVLTDEQ
ncbi:hypothetical protein ACFSO0_05135 [Brevibacillus sp. GCM10020057]|uniref:hypothetical protein n=1 Tax=Brevibacillus sp. GCM10020057 TaxID=3317327 RepID=UPI0036250407